MQMKMFRIHFVTQEVLLMEEFTPPQQMKDPDEKARYCVVFDQSTFAYKVESPPEENEPNANEVKTAKSKLKEGKCLRAIIHKSSLFVGASSVQSASALSQLSDPGVSHCPVYAGNLSRRKWEGWAASCVWSWVHFDCRRIRGISLSEA